MHIHSHSSFCNDTSNANWNNIVFGKYGENHKNHIHANDNGTINSSQFEVLHHDGHKLEAEAEEEKGCRYQLHT